jgi:hypothetical protein
MAREFEPGSLRKTTAAGDPEIARKPATHTKDERVYVHELLDISVKYKRDYLDHFSRWADETGCIAGKNRVFGVWGTVGFTHRWPEAVIMWEFPSKMEIARRWKEAWAHHHAQHPDGSPDMTGDIYTSHWRNAPQGVVDTQGMNRLMAAAAYNPTMEDLMAQGVRGDGYLHLMTYTRPGEIDDHLERLGREWVPIAERLGLKFIGAYRTMFVNDDAGLSVWALPTYEAWAEFEDARRTDKEALEWRAEIAARGVTWDGRVMTPAAGHPLNKGEVRKIWERDV